MVSLIGKTYRNMGSRKVLQTNKIKVKESEYRPFTFTFRCCARFIFPDDYVKSFSRVLLDVLETSVES